MRNVELVVTEGLIFRVIITYKAPEALVPTVHEAVFQDQSMLVRMDSFKHLYCALIFLLFLL